MRALLTVALLALAPISATADRPEPFTFAVLGDTQDVSPVGLDKLRLLIERINQNAPAFSVDIGEFKGGSDPCDEAYYRRVLSTLNRFAQPVIFTPGDNDWTDCPKPLESLAQVRSVLFTTETSLGQTTLPLQRQSSEENFASFVENALWQQGNVVFATFHNVGSNNNLMSNAEAVQEHLTRNAANLAWLETTFAKATESNAAAVVILTHANLQFGNPGWRKSGFDSFREALTKHVIAYDKPVLLVHGDSHTFTIDKAMKDTAGKTVPNATRLEVFGSPDLGAVFVTVDTSKAQPFSFRPVMVK